MWKINRKQKNKINNQQMPTLHGPNGLTINNKDKTEHIDENYYQIHFLGKQKKTIQHEINTFKNRILYFAAQIAHSHNPKK